MKYLCRLVTTVSITVIHIGLLGETSVQQNVAMFNPKYVISENKRITRVLYSEVVIIPDRIYVYVNYNLRPRTTG
jgi:hypothetical protein